MNSKKTTTKKSVKGQLLAFVCPHGNIHAGFHRPQKAALDSVPHPLRRSPTCHRRQWIFNSFPPHWPSHQMSAISEPQTVYVCLCAAPPSTSLPLPSVYSTMTCVLANAIWLVEVTQPGLHATGVWADMNGEGWCQGTMFFSKCSRLCLPPPEKYRSVDWCESFGTLWIFFFLCRPGFKRFHKSTCCWGQRSLNDCLKEKQTELWEQQL